MTTSKTCDNHSDRYNGIDVKKADQILGKQQKQAAILH